MWPWGCSIHRARVLISYSDYIQKLRNRLKTVYKIASHNMKKASRRQKFHYDLRVRGATPQIGDRVLVKKTGLTGKHKLADKWEKDAYLITEQPNKDIPVYVIHRENGKGRTRTVHRNLLLPLALPLSRKQIKEPEVRIGNTKSSKQDQLNHPAGSQSPVRTSPDASQSEDSSDEELGARSSWRADS